MAEKMQVVSELRMTVEHTQKKQWRRLCGSGNLYAIVDSCGQPLAPLKCRELGPARAISLYRSAHEDRRESAGSRKRRGLGDAERYAGVAPYLFQLDEATFDWIASPSFWPTPWGILLYAQTNLTAVRTHLRRFLKVRGVDKRVYFLRFYDPRVLPAFLSSCNDSELAGFFGPVMSFGVASGDGVAVLRRPG
jgi:hypothetical protein